MAPIVYSPDRKLLHKSYIKLLLVGLLCFAVSGSLGFYIERHLNGFSDGRLGAMVGVLIHLTWFLPALILIPFYCRSLFYELHQDGVVMHAGVFTRSVKHIPFLAITNLKVKRGLLDRLFSLGTVGIQAAGMSWQNGTEESLVGLDAFKEVYDLLVAGLHRVRGAATPGQAGITLSQEERDTLGTLIDEVRMLRGLLMITRCEHGGVADMIPLIGERPPRLAMTESPRSL
jgi:membrane protein YdbS with pleckstrin-like domain